MEPQRQFRTLGEVFLILILCVLGSTQLMAATNLNSSRSNAQRLAYPTDVVTSTQAAAILADLEAAGWLDEETLRQLLQQLLPKHGIQADRIRAISVGTGRYMACSDCVFGCAGKCVYVPNGMGECFCYEPLRTDRQSRKDMSIVICLLEDPADEDKALEIIAASGSCVPPPSGMVAWWPLDETSGTTVQDSVGGFNGTTQPGSIGAFGGPGPVTSASWPLPTFPAGMVDNSLFFYGNRHVKVPHSTALDPGTGDFTIDAWVIYAAAGKGQFLTIVRKAGGGAGTPTTSPLAGSGYQLVIQDSSANSGQLSFNVKGSLGDSLAWNPITPNIWHHVAVTVQRTTGVYDASITLYFDGATVANPNAHLGNVANNWDLLIGGDGVLAGEIAVDEVEIFNLALPQSDIQAIFDAGQAGKCKRQPCVTPPSGMVAWYPLDEQVGAIAVNDIAPGFNNVGTPHAANGLPTSVSATPGPPPAGPVPVTAPPLNLMSGMVGSALYFYGPYIEVADHQDLDFGTGSFSIDAWIYIMYPCRQCPLGVVQSLRPSWISSTQSRTKATPSSCTSIQRAPTCGSGRGTAPPTPSLGSWPRRWRLRPGTILP